MKIRFDSLEDDKAVFSGHTIERIVGFLCIAGLCLPKLDYYSLWRDVGQRVDDSTKASSRELLCQ